MKYFLHSFQVLTVFLLFLGYILPTVTTTYDTHPVAGTPEQRRRTTQHPPELCEPLVGWIMSASRLIDQRLRLYKLYCLMQVTTKLPLGSGGAEIAALTTAFSLRCLRYGVAIESIGLGILEAWVTR
jgi:hypothetical protein